MVTVTPLEAELLRIAGAVPDPELPVLTLRELGVVRAVHVRGADAVEVELTPTYTGCPAVEAMSLDIERALRARGMREVTVRTVLSPAWSTDDITDEGRRKLREFGIAPPRVRRDVQRDGGPVPLELGPTRTRAAAADPVRCPRCGCADTELLSRFSSTACKALRRCLACREPFDHFKEL
ncbi:phenylacetic acid degradation protein PaaD [Streptomyces cyaneogriseus subsp. noncyanogenus]|uniref:Phenylacetic acid degradation protein PaaD n=1 Tax=Streptomyces cyaneogriseus subsp. noncyanogenus TaxID=477245 RepID=A0A0C5GEP1_9ACTN|nr:1,2-phenylacetyl-CoA epoxidase subunit PaaD [Streptomyces cyaneogriseus]AJP02806.1 phenylacetic acid degradation protein PaaD [Streptomyces cyaneogriseus subsp. noncyanogenus]